MQKNQPQRRLVFLIFLPPLLATCLCAAFSIPRLVDFYHSPAYPDYLWSLRITHELSAKGYPVHDVSVSGSELSGSRDIFLQVGNQVEGKPQRTYELVKKVHSVIMETFDNTSAQPEPVDAIAVMVIDYSSGSYLVSVDYETVQQFHAGEISEQAYFEHWYYPEDTPNITPP